MTYQQVFDIIKAALTLRTSTKVQVEDHESAEIAILDYVEQLKNQTSGSYLREAHASTVAGVNCNLVWNTVFSDTNYSYTINGFDTTGQPVEISLISKSSTKLIIKTLANATITALAIPYGVNP